MGYKKLEQGPDTVFEVTPEEAPSLGFGIKGGITIVRALGWLFLAALFLSVMSLFGKIGGTVGLALIGVFVWRRAKRPKEQSLITKDRAPAKFSVNREGISLNGQVFKKADIHRIVTRNEVLARTGNTTLVYDGGSAASRNYAAGAKIGMEWNRRLAAVSYTVEFESGGVPHVLAGGLTEAGAFAIQSDVSGILGFA